MVLNSDGYANESLLKDNTSTATSTTGTTTPETAATDFTAQSTCTKDLTIEAERLDRDKSVGSESEDDIDDLEPHQMLDSYIKLMSKLHKRQPALTEIATLLKRKGNAKQKAASVKPDAASTRILQKVRKIESDILFDNEAAQDAWRDVRVRLLRDAADRKKLGIGHEEPPLEGGSQSSQALPGAGSQGQGEQADDAMDLGDFFGSLPEEQVDNDTGNRAMTVNSGGVSITIRDFGKWVGVNPRRTLEETCRARESSVKVTFNVLSSSSFSNRHSVKIAWSKAQDLPDETSIPGIFARADERNVQLEMTSISTPDKTQSEAFISTAALFLIFAPSPKEEKAYLRLPAAFRDLWGEFSALREERLNSFSRDEVRRMRKLVDDHHIEYRENSQPQIPKTRLKEEDFNAELDDDSVVRQVDRASIKALWSSKSSPFYQRMLAGRKRLPVWSFRSELLQTIENHQVVIICGETGCGKSTQVPSFILEQELLRGKDCKIYCTEPRRISAISLARRVSEELGERKNDVGTERSLVGYAIRLENQVSSSTRLVYATTGIVMRMLESADGLEEVSHVVLDEVHERTIDSDFLLVILRRLLVKRPTLKVILMSATVNAERFSRYLNGAPVLNVPGRTFPVETKYLEDAFEVIGALPTQLLPDEVELDDEIPDEAQNSTLNDDLSGYSAQTRKLLAQFNEYRINYGLIVKLLEVIATSKEYEQYSKAILVFLPGLAEIRRVNDMLVGHPTFSHHWQIFPLHSTIATDTQEAAFHIPPLGVRKIVLATNIAETGITIPDITCVIDSGKHREMR